MAIVVEDGTIVSGANSYVSEADLEAFATARGITLTADPAILLIKAMDYIESLGYKGYKSSSTQELQWPRYGVYVDGYCIDSDVIPTALKNGLMQTAISIDEGYDPTATLTQAVKRERVDVIEVEYMDGSSASPIIKKINLSLSKLLSGYGGSVVRVSKA
jgi:hypothetical protein